MIKYLARLLIATLTVLAAPEVQLNIHLPN